uniref:RNA-binding protein 34 n=1 Tax=Steinernema glaseri TaxID=37863 RepID=A0A1I7ZL22_9BILA
MKSVGCAQQTTSKKASEKTTTATTVRDRAVQRANRKLRQTAEEEEAENKKTVFVGNVSREVTKRQLHKLFSEAGKIENIRLRGIYPAKETLGKRVAVITNQINENVPTQFYFIRYADEEAAKSAVEMLNARVVKEYPLRVDLCSAKPVYSSKLSVFVGNLPFEAKEEEVRQHFESQEIQPVDFVRIVRDAETGLGKGFGFVCFKDRSLAKKALKLNDTEFCGRKIRVTRTNADGNVKTVKKPKRKNAQAGSSTSRILTSNAKAEKVGKRKPRNVGQRKKSAKKTIMS